MNAVELPAVSDPLVRSYLRVMNSNAPNQELQRERDDLRLRFPELLAVCKGHLVRCDEVQSQLLLVERTEVGKQAKAILLRIDALQQANGLRTSSQSQLQDHQQTATRKLQSFTPRNRTIATLQQIEEDRVEENELKKAVDRSKQTIVQNQRSILECGEQVKALRREYDGLAAREEQISKQIEELKLPFEERGKRRSSVVWQDGGSTFGLVLP